MTNPSQVFIPNDIAFSGTLQINLEQLKFLINQSIRLALSEMTTSAVDEDDWSLTGEQILFMFQHHNEIASSFEADEFEHLRDLAASDEYLAAFGEMGFDEAYDRYLTALEEGRD